MSSKNETEINSIFIPTLAAGIFCAVVLLIRTFGPEPKPAEFGNRIDTPILYAWEGLEPDDEFGHAVLGGMDINGDGIQDFIIGAPQAKNGGHVRAFNGANGKALWGPIAAPAGMKGFGSSLAFVPDHNGDGGLDVLIGAPGAEAGHAVLVSGSKGQALLTVRGKKAHEHFGATVCALDDVNGDGIPDFAVGAPGDQHRSVVGCVRIISGSDGSLLREIKATPRLGDRFGFAMTAPGDLNGDGRIDLVVSAIGATRTGFNAGAIFAFSPRSGAELYRLDGKNDEDELGHDLDPCGDRTGDGVGDFFASAFNPHGEGYVLLVNGKTGAIVSRHSSGTENGLGHSVAACGDMDGDGVPDFAAGAPKESHFGHPNVGFVYVFSGKTGEVIETLEGDRGLAGFGYDLAGLGDMDGDGRAEILIGTSIIRERVGRAVISHLRKKEN